MVGREIAEQDRALVGDYPSDREHRDRCERWRLRILDQHKQDRETGDRQGSMFRGRARSEETRGPYQPERNRGHLEGTTETQGETTWKAFSLVHRLYDSPGSHQETGDAKAVKGSMGHNQEGARPDRARGDKALAKACPWETERGGRCSFASLREEGWLGRGRGKGDEKMGAFAGRPLWRDRRNNIAARRARVGPAKNAFTPKGVGHKSGCKVLGAMRGKRGATRRPNNMGADGSAYNATVERNYLVAKGREDEDSIPAAGEDRFGGHRRMEAEKWAQSRLDSLFDPSKNPLWAARTREKYEGILFRFLVWQELHNLGPREGEELGKSAARGLRRYIYSLAERLSGEALATNAKGLLVQLKDFISRKKEEKIKIELPILRKRANMKNPPQTRAAEAISWENMKELLERAKEANLSKMERQALDIFLIAFMTVSRVGEVAALEVENTAQDGTMIEVRPKTSAKTWLRLRKKVPDTAGFKAANKVREYRRRAIKQGRRTLFRGRGRKPPTTSSITSLLKRITTKVGIRARITAHSARKGAAVEALLAGVPLPVIQALGGWSDVNTLQAYIAEAIRRSTSLVGVLKGRRRRKGVRG